MGSFLLFFAVVVAVYVKSLGHPLIFDDSVILQQNEFLQYSNIPHFFRSFFMNSDLGFLGYRPLLMTTFVFDKELWSLNPSLSRLFNIMIHSLNGWFVFSILQKLFPKLHLRWTIFFSLVFLLHPIQTNVINLVWKRSDLLVGLGFFACFYFYLLYRQSLSIRDGFLSVFFYIFASLSKENAFVIPLFLGFFEFLWRDKPLPKKMIRFYFALGLVLLTHLLILFFIQKLGIPQSGVRIQSYFPESLLLSPLDYARTQIVGFMHYWNLLLFPVNLRVFHHLEPIRQWTEPLFVGSMIAFLIYLVVFLKMPKSFRGAKLGGISLVLFLLPTSSIFPLSMILDEDRLYLPVFSLVLMIAGVMLSCSESNFEKFKRLKIVLIPFSFILLGLFAGLSHFRTNDWQSALRLFGRNVLDEPEDPRAWVALGSAFVGANQLGRAREAFNKAYALNSSYTLAKAYSINTFLEEGDWDNAEAGLRELKGEREFSYFIAHQRGVLALGRGDLDKAEQFFEESIERNPKYLPAWRNLIRLHANRNNGEKALEVGKSAIQTNPFNLNLQILLAEVYWHFRKDADGSLLLIEEILKKDQKNQKALLLRDRILLAKASKNR